MTEPVSTNGDIEQGMPEVMSMGGIADSGQDASLSQKNPLEEGKCEDHPDHGHSSPTPVSLVASSIVCFEIYFVFCIVFSFVVWDPLNLSLNTSIDPPFGIPQGVGINLLGITIGCLYFTLKSGCRAIVAGPDLLPIVFFAEAGMTVVVYLASQASHAPCKEVEDYGYGHRFLGGKIAYAYGDDPCVFHRNLAGNAPLSDPDLIAQVVPTTLIAMVIGNMVTGLVSFGLGKMKNTASVIVIRVIPASVIAGAGFLTCIGYKVCLLSVVYGTH